ncbi:MAG: helix-turn-helix transcriptional regulator [Cyclobacteriaceae bacterium]
MTATYLPDNMKLLRKRRGLTQQQMAQGIGISTAAYNNYESGKRQMPPEKVEELGGVLEVNAYDLQHTDLAELPEGAVGPVHAAVRSYDLAAMPRDELVAYCRSLQQEVGRLRDGLAKQKTWRREVLDTLAYLQKKA